MLAGGLRACAPDQHDERSRARADGIDVSYSTGSDADVDSLGELIGESPAMVALRASVRRLIDMQSQARRPAPILLLGETGTGKGLLAKLLHREGPRRGGPFVDVNCPAIPNSLM